MRQYVNSRVQPRGGINNWCKSDWRVSVAQCDREYQNLHKGEWICYRSRTYRDSTQPVACISGYEHSDQILRSDQAAFQATQKTSVILHQMPTLLTQCISTIMTSNIEQCNVILHLTSQWFHYNVPATETNDGPTMHLPRWYVIKAARIITGIHHLIWNPAW